jgi:NAD dependent epimerase/dehydratase family enzyme
LGGRIGDGHQYMSWIHINDMCKAINHLLFDVSAKGAFNLASPHALSNRLFTDTLAGVLNTKARLPMPEILLRLLMGESADLLLTSQNVYPQKLLELGFEFDFSTLEVALNELLHQD